MAMTAATVTAATVTAATVTAATVTAATVTAAAMTAAAMTAAATAPAIAATTIGAAIAVTVAAIVQIAAVIRGAPKDSANDGASNRFSSLNLNDLQVRARGWWIGQANRAGRAGRGGEDCCGDRDCGDANETHLTPLCLMETREWRGQSALASVAAHFGHLFADSLEFRLLFRV